MGKRNRQRSESFGGEQENDDDARKRLADFRARMFELPQEETTAAVRETPRVLFKNKLKKNKKKSTDNDDGEPMPIVKFHKNKVKKEKKHTEKKKVAAVQEKKVVTGLSVVNVPGETNVGIKKEKKAAAIVSNPVKKEKKEVTVVSNSLKKEKKVKQHKQKQTTVVQTVKKTLKVQVQAQEDDGVDALEQALGKMKEMAMQQVAKPPQKKQKNAKNKAIAVPKKEETKDPVEFVKKKNDTVDFALETNDGNEQHANVSKRKKKKMKRKRKQLQEQVSSDSNHPSDSLTTTKETKNDLSANTSKTDLSKVDDAPTNKSSASSPKSVRSRKNRKKSPKADGVNSVSPITYSSTQPRQGKPLIVPDELEHQTTSNENSVCQAPAVSFKAEKAVSAKNEKEVVKTAVAVRKEEESPALEKQLTPIAVSLAEDAKKKDDMFMPAQDAPRQPHAARTQVPKSVAALKEPTKAVAAPVFELTDESSSDSDEDGGLDLDHRNGNESSLFSRLIDSAARERWELVEVGRLVRLFATEWDFKESKTAQFLCETCPELVSVDFLEGLGINLSAKQLVQVFEAGSGNSGVLMNKMASAVENGHLSVRDPSFVSALERRVALMETNGEVMELIYPILESLSTVRDVGCLLNQLCEYWQLERKIALVQQVLLSHVFDDLDGNQDEILIDLPDLNGRLDFPSRLDQEDVDENGNLKGFLVEEVSEASGEEGSEEEMDEDDSEVEDEPYEGETDSDEEIEITGRSRGRNQFIEDEADVGEDDEEEEAEERHDDDGSSSDSD